MVSLQDKKVILDNVCKLVPSLKLAKLVRDWVGLRPYREPVRLQLDHHEVRQPCLLATYSQNTGRQVGEVTHVPPQLNAECTDLELSRRKNFGH